MDKMNKKIKKVNFHFDNDDIFEGFSDGTKWNGFDNIHVTEATFVMILDSWATERDICISELIQTDWFDLGCDLPLSTEYKIDGEFLFDLNGFVTNIYNGLTDKELKDLYKIQGYMLSEIFYVEEDIDSFEDIDENDNMYNSLIKAISILENK